MRGKDVLLTLNALWPYLFYSFSDCRAVLIRDNDSSPSPEDEFLTKFDDDLISKQIKSNVQSSSNDFQKFDALLQNIQKNNFSSKSPKKKEALAKGILS